MCVNRRAKPAQGHKPYKSSSPNGTATIKLIVPEAANAASQNPGQTLWTVSMIGTGGVRIAESYLAAGQFMIQAS